MRTRDNQREKLYSAEKSLASWRPISTWIEWKRNEKRVRRLDAYYRKFPESTRYDTSISRPEPEQRPMSLTQTRRYIRTKVRSDWYRKEFGGRGTEIEVVSRKSNACASCHPWGYAAARLKLPEWSRWPITILHELAHAITPAGCAWHGPEFALIFIKLVGHYIGTEEAKELKVVFRKYRVDYRRRSNGTHRIR